MSKGSASAGEANDMKARKFLEVELVELVVKRLQRQRKDKGYKRRR